MVKRIIILTFVFLSILILSQAVMNLWNLHSSINTEYLVDSAIHVVEDNHEEDNLSIENNTDYNSAIKQNLSSSICLCSISGISPSIWQPPE
jgi:hypothetical protein